jgi:Aldehyde dehydrogenase family
VHHSLADLESWVGDLRDPATAIGPLVNARQYDRVQRYSRVGIEAGATLVAGGEGHPDGLGGYFVRPTLFADVMIRWRRSVDTNNPALGGNTAYSASKPSSRPKRSLVLGSCVLH